MDYGTGAIFACPAHDQRDLDFCRKYELPVIDTFLALDDPTPVYTDAFVPPKTDKVKWINHFAGLDVATGEEAIDATIDFAEKAGWGKGVTNYRLRDWGLVAPTLLGLPDPGRALRRLRRGAREEGKPAGRAAYDEDGAPIDFTVPGNPLDRHPTWRDCTCPSCGKPAKRETDTMDTFVDSSGISRASRPRAPKHRPIWTTPAIG